MAIDEILKTIRKELNISQEQVTRQTTEKRKALEEWISAVNQLGEYGEWCSDISTNIADVDGIIAKWMSFDNNAD